MNKTERANLIAILEMAQACHIQLGNFLTSHARTFQAASGSIKQEHLIEQTEAILETLLMLHNRLGNSFQPFEDQIALAFFERSNEVMAPFSFEHRETPILEHELEPAEEPEC